MVPDPEAEAQRVTRLVRTGARGSVPTRTTALSRLYRTDQPDLWDAVTTAERIERWFLPISGQLQLGGRYQLDGNASGTIELCDEPNSFAVTWEYGGSISWLSVSLRAVAGGTELEVSHQSPPEPDFWARYGPGATGLGWDLGLFGLGRYVEDGTEFGPAQETAFAASPAGASFLEAAGSAWAEAAVADGDDRSSAIAAAKRSVAFYQPADEAPSD